MAKGLDKEIRKQMQTINGNQNIQIGSIHIESMVVTKNRVAEPKVNDKHTFKLYDRIAHLSKITALNRSELCNILKSAFNIDDFHQLTLKQFNCAMRYLELFTHCGKHYLIH